MNNLIATEPSRFQYLQQHDVNFYHDQGYLILKSVVPTEVIDNLASEIELITRERPDLMDARNMRVRFAPHVSTGEPLFEVFDPFVDLSPTARAVTQWPAILDILHDLYGEPACLFKDKLIYKPPGARGATLHQDWIGWPGFPETFLTVVVAIDSFTDGSGATQVYAAHHKQGYLSPIDGQHHLLRPDQLHGQPVLLELEPGDVAIFGCFTPHVSSPNVSQTSRRGYFISYNAISDGGDQYQRHYAEFHEWIRAKLPVESREQFYFK